MADRHVVPVADGWHVEKDKAQRASAKVATRAEAVTRATEIISNDGGGRLVVHGSDGEVSETRTVEANAEDTAATAAKATASATATGAARTADAAAEKVGDTAEKVGQDTSTTAKKVAGQTRTAATKATDTAREGASQVAAEARKASRDGGRGAKSASSAGRGSSIPATVVAAE